ncbi:D-alanine--D-alanine ligase family protein [Clostridium sp. Cult3]|uniref:D-alanine--D-alanine ligase family protein n=1 Tax=Clostridium sp. Cult3 TaxID=2079004 RepID=UPI001F2038A8|nr:D-alanine--D-alanine ligase family protein [Clostridium sp. Cult3]MCF6460950.1 D-alanine--D-alanine ligase [Clostridium sp. Cult3]
MKKRVAVIFGGRSVEHEVSVITGLQVMENIDKDKYHVIPIYIDKEGKWFTGDSLMKFENFKDSNLDDLQEVVLTPKTNDHNLYSHPENIGLFKKKVMDKIDIIFPTIHGTNGEDGTIQGLFELMNIPYVGSGVLASSVGMDKILMKDVFKANGLPIVDYMWFYRREWIDDQKKTIKDIEEGLGYPVFVKPANLGSSIGISKAKDREGLIHAMEIAIRYDRKIIVEEAIENPREINCAVMGYDDNVIASLCEEPLGWDEILTFEDKYIKSNAKGLGKEGSRRIIPADIEDNIRENIEDIASKAFMVIDGEGNARIDFLLDRDNNIYVNEINTLPGSIAFYLWEGKGYSFQKLIDNMIDIAIRVHDEKNNNMYHYDADLFNKVHLGGSKVGKM